MANPQLHSYIVAQEHAGFSEEQIRAALLQGGYGRDDVNDAFRELRPQKPDQVVREYAQQYAQQGYSAAQAFDQLGQQGYPAGQARRAVKEAFGTPVTEHRAPTTVFVLVALLVGAGGMYLFLGPGPHAEQPIPVLPEQRLAESEVIANVLELARTDRDAGVQQCHERLTGTHRERCLAAVAAGTEDLQLCRQITTAEIHDGCLLYFLNQDFDTVCSAVKLAESRDTCDAVRNLRGSAALST